MSCTSIPMSREMYSWSWKALCSDGKLLSKMGRFVSRAKVVTNRLSFVYLVCFKRLPRSLNNINSHGQGQCYVIHLTTCKLSIGVDNGSWYETILDSCTCYLFRQSYIHIPFSINSVYDSNHYIVPSVGTSLQCANSNFILAAER